MGICGPKRMAGDNSMKEWGGRSVGAGSWVGFCRHRSPSQEVKRAELLRNKHQRYLAGCSDDEEHSWK